jgi:hypothetical protein
VVIRTSPAPAAPTPVELLDQAVAAVRAEPIDGLHDTALGERIVALARAIDALQGDRARCVAGFERQRGHRTEGATSMVAWAIARCRMSPGAAAEMVCTARQLEELPETARALREGEIGYPHASVIARTAGDIGAGVVREAEADLLTRARGFDVREFACLMRRFRECVDPDGALRDANRDHERTRVHLSQTLGGRFRLDGDLDAEAGATLSTALNRYMRPVPGDRRSASQRRAAALVELCHRDLTHEERPQLAGQRPHLSVTVPVATLSGEPGWPGGELRWGGPVVADTARRLACDAVRTDVTVGPEGELLSVSRPAPTVPPWLRRQLAARDRGCRFPGCDRPPEWTEAHHIVPRAAHGPNDLPNLVMVCRLHHRLVHEGGWRIRRGEEGDVEAEPP